MPNLAIEALLLQQNWQVARPHLDNEIPNVVSSSDQFFSGNSSNSMQGGSDGASSASLSPPISTSRRTRKGRKSTSPKLDSNANTKSSAKGSKKYVCQTCGRSFDYKHVLQNHERTHTGEKPFTCTQCKKKFTRDHHLKTHMRLHTGEKPYKCEHCPKDFVQVANLRRHTRVHTGERPYDCKICPSRFSDSNQLKAHVLIHSGEKPFECIKCHHPFRRRHHLNGHNCPELLKAKAKAKAEIPLKIDNVDLPTMSHLSTMSLHFQSINGPLNLTVDHVQTEPVDLSVRGSISNSFDL